MTRAGILGQVSIAAAAMLALACSSSSQYEEIQAKLEEIQFEILELRKQSPSKSEIDELEDAVSSEVQALVRSQGASERKLEELARKIIDLEAKLEDTNFKLARLTQQIEATNQELQAARAAAEVVRPSPPPPETPDPTDPQALYDTAYNDYDRGSYDLAILGFRQYLDLYGGADLADNAAYWIGECYFRQGKFQKAIDQFDELLTRFQHSDRNPSALLKKGQAYFELGQRARGVVQLQNVICEHSDTDEARIARQRLRELGIDADC